MGDLDLARRAMKAAGHLVDDLHRMLTAWVRRGDEWYRYSIPSEAELAAGRQTLAAPVRCTPIGWTVWDTGCARIVAHGAEQGDAGRQAADAAARRAGWLEAAPTV